MRKAIYILASLLCILTLAACGNTSADTVKSSETELATEGQMTEAVLETLSENNPEDDVAGEETDEDSISSTSQDIIYESTEENAMESMIIYVTVNGETLTAILEENSSAVALYERLSEGDITVDMSDYANFEKVGSLGFNLPRNDSQYTTKAGDIILYQGSSIVFYYDTNSWNFTKLGEFQNISQTELMEIFGDGDIVAVISVNE